ncbi:MAG: UDP-N-acetylmuramate--L-alanine ligase [Bacteroidia bacterium]
MVHKKNIYFLGIGGIGMSALARYFHAQGYTVAGYDKTPSPLTEKLQEEGISVNFKDEVQCVDSVYLEYKLGAMIVYTPAMPSDSVLLNYFRDEEYTMAKRAEVLGIVTKQTLNLSVAGTHGKTTTSSIVATILQYSEKKFSAFLGGISTNLGSNYFYQDGDGEHFSVTEADEFDRSFLHLSPNFTIVTSTDADHLDIYGKKEDLEKSYIEFSDLVELKSHVFYAKGFARNIEGVSYSASDTLADFYAKILSKDGRGTRFTICKRNGEEMLKELYLNIPGLHNLENAVGATLMTLEAGVSENSIREGLASFKGIKRRFEYVVDRENIKYIDDYAHHPSELKAIISSVKDLYPTKRITAVFQPHLFSRTQDFMDDFARELDAVDDLILVPIYPARELPIEGVTSEALLAKITLDNAIHVRKEVVVSVLSEKNVEVLLTLGAGDIDRLVNPIKELYEE